MHMDPLVDIEQLVLALLQKRKRDYLTVKQIVAGLPSAPRKRLALSTSQRQLTTGVKEHEQTIVALERV
jgi:hypothetical protein